MTLILTSLSHHQILQIADRRLTFPDGKLYDDDTNKAVFYRGRVAVAYTGLAVMEGKPTAKWIGVCMQEETNLEEAMHVIATRANQHLNKIHVPDKRLAIIATGWGINKGAPPPLPFVSVATNFMDDRWQWQGVITGPMMVRTRFLSKRQPNALFVAGQNLTKAEHRNLSRQLRRAIKHKTTGTLLARLLANTLQAIAQGTDRRAMRVGKGMIIHLLTKAPIISRKKFMVVTPLTDDSPSFLYVSKEGKTDRFQGPVIACKDLLITGFGGGTIPSGGKGVIRTEMESMAKKYPITLAKDEMQYSSECPFCAQEGKTTSSYSPTTVSGELSFGMQEKWIMCRGDLGHLLLVKREES